MWPFSWGLIDFGTDAAADANSRFGNGAPKRVRISDLCLRRAARMLEVTSYSACRSSLASTMRTHRLAPIGSNSSLKS